MADPFLAIVSVIAFLGLVIAAYLSYRVYSFNRLNERWLAMVLGFIAAAMSRSFGLGARLGWFPDLHPSLLDIWAEMMIVIASILFITGMWSMMRSFETFEVIEKRTIEKATAFDRMAVRSEGKRRRSR